MLKEKECYMLSWQNHAPQTQELSLVLKAKIEHSTPTLEEQRPRPHANI